MPADSNTKLFRKPALTLPWTSTHKTPLSTQCYSTQSHAVYFHSKQLNFNSVRESTKTYGKKGRGHNRVQYSDGAIGCPEFQAWLHATQKSINIRNSRDLRLAGPGKLREGERFDAAELEQPTKPLRDLLRLFSWAPHKILAVEFSCLCNL